MISSDQRYLTWQKKLAVNKAFRFFWVWWGIYSVAIYGLIVLYLLFYLHGERAVILAAVSAAFARLVVCEIIALIYKKPHPYQRLNFTPPTSWVFSLADKRYDGFPSQHISTAAAISLSIYLFFPGWGLLALATSAFMGMGRIIIGFHDALDVIFGFVAGLLSAYISYIFLYSWLFTR